MLYYVQVFFSCTTQPNALKGYEAYVHLSTKPNWHINKY